MDICTMYWLKCTQQSEPTTVNSNEIMNILLYIQTVYIYLLYSMWSDLDVCVLDIHTSMHLLSSLKTPPHCRWNGWAYLEEIAGWVTSSWLTNTSHWASNLMNQWSIVIFLWFSYFHIIISSRCHGIIGYILLPMLRELHLCFSKSPVPPGDLPQQGVATFGWLVEAFGPFGPFGQRFQVMKLHKIHERIWLFIFHLPVQDAFFLCLTTWSFWWSKIPFIRIEHRLYGRRAGEMSNPTIVTGISELGKYGTRTFQLLYIWIPLALTIQFLTRTN